MVVVGGGDAAEEVVVGWKKSRRGIKIGNPADWTKVDIHLLLPPLS